MGSHQVPGSRRFVSAWRAVRRPVRAGLAVATVLSATLVLVHPNLASAATTFTVTTTADSGAGSLRAAITAANADATASVGAPHRIEFAIPGAGVQTINVLTALPALSNPTVIDGLTQPGSTCGSSGTSRSLLIAIRGQGNAVVMSGLVLSGGGSTVQGVAVSFFRTGNVVSTGAAGGDRIRCNHIGLSASGGVDTIASNGGTMSGNPVTTYSLDVSSPNTIIGGPVHTLATCDGDCNAITGESGNNNQAAILLRFGAIASSAFNFPTPATSVATGGTMQGNFIGVQQNGQNIAPAFKSGRLIHVMSTSGPTAAAPAVPTPIPSSGGYLIGGLDGAGDRDPFASNLISGAKYRDGFDTDTGTGSASGIRIHGNLIGTGPTGTEVTDGAGVRYGNARDGVQIEGAHATDIQANVISGNGSNGIQGASIGSNVVVKNNLIGLNEDLAPNGNGWYFTAIAAGDPNFGMGPATVTTNAGTGNGITIGSSGGSVPNRDVDHMTIDGNVIGANARAGIIAAGGSGFTTISNNFIGVTPGGAAIPNVAAGVIMMTDSNTITSNVIAHNGGPGVTILRNTNPLIGTAIGAWVPIPATATGNLISQNSIYANTGVGIDLNAVSSAWGASGNTLLFPYAWTQGVTPNDGALSPAPPTNAGTFGNRDVDYPVITSAEVSSIGGGTLTVSGFVGLSGGSAAFAGAVVEIFRGDDSPADQNGEIYVGDGASVAHPEGRTYIGSCTVDAAGAFTDCVLALPASAPLASWSASSIVTSTATISGTTTSEFGPLLAATLVSIIDLELTKTIDPVGPYQPGQSVDYLLTLVNDGPDDATGVTVSDQLPANASYQSATASRGTYDDATGIWSVGDLDAGETVELRITV